MNKYIVVTTIFDVSPALRRYAEVAEQDGWNLIIVGDKKTPHDAYWKFELEHPRTRYFHPDDQASKYPAYSEFLGWNTCSRRNIGFIEAYHCGADILALVDDDNIPMKGWGQNLALFNEVDATKWSSYSDDNLIFDPMFPVSNFYSNTSPKVWHRGFPLEKLLSREEDYVATEVITSRFLVQADFWLGNPDVDALARLMMKFDDKMPCSLDQLAKKNADDFGWNYDDYWTHDFKFSPFNSQATFLRREAIPSFFMVKEAGRPCDIWGSYLLQKDFGPGCIVYGKPSVWQERNDHVIMKDFANEVFGTINVLGLLNGTFNLPDCIEAHQEIYKKQFERF